METAMSTEKPVNSVKVRMYRHGFGDCFLLSFYRDKDRVFTMLIDCGIKHNTKSEDVPIEETKALCAAVGRPLATFAQTRQILGMPAG